MICSSVILIRGHEFNVVLSLLITVSKNLELSVLQKRNPEMVNKYLNGYRTTERQRIRNGISQAKALTST